MPGPWRRSSTIRIREGLTARGLILPPETVVVGGYHNTCNDSVTFSDLDRLPPSHQEEFDAVRRYIELTCNRNAHEHAGGLCRRR